MSPPDYGKSVTISLSFSNLILSEKALVLPLKAGLHFHRFLFPVQLYSFSALPAPYS